jgi:AraC-like DNA-binding protein
MARPRLTIDPQHVLALARIHCTYDEIASVVGCSTDTLKRRFADLIEKGREEGKASLRRMQFKRALEGNTTMLIWLGKQHLGQSDQQRIEAVGNGGGPLGVVVTHEVVDPSGASVDS